MEYFCKPPQLPLGATAESELRNPVGVASSAGGGGYSVEAGIRQNPGREYPVGVDFDQMVARKATPMPRYVLPPVPNAPAGRVARRRVDRDGGSHHGGCPELLPI